MVPKDKPLTQGCPSTFSKATCDACLASSHPEDCFTCARLARYYGRGAAHCAACAELSTAQLRGTCTTCLRDYGPDRACASCLAIDPYSFDQPALDLEKTEACFTCVAEGGASLRDTTGCSSCHALGAAGGDVAACLACASDMSLPPAARAGCASCHAQGVGDPTGCLACLQQPGVTSAKQATTCADCSLYGMGAITGMCYRCVAAAGEEGAWYCGYLGEQKGTLLHSSLLLLTPSYYQCIAATAGASSGANDCNSCLVNLYEHAELAEHCFACVTSLQGTPNSGWCSSCCQHSKQPGLCQQCLATAYDSLACSLDS